jgi:uridine kinase
MNKTITLIINGIQGEYSSPVALLELSKLEQQDHPVPIVAAVVNNVLTALPEKLSEDSEVLFVDLQQAAGISVYQRSLAFLLVVAATELFPDAKVTIEHSLSRGLYCEVHKTPALSKADVTCLELQMQQIVQENRQITRRIYSLSDALTLFEQRSQQEQVKLLQQRNPAMVQIYFCGKVMEFDSGILVPETGYLQKFSLQYWQPGLIIRHVLAEDPAVIPAFLAQPKLSAVFREAEHEGQLLNCSYVSDLNEQTKNGLEADLIRAAEAGQEKRVAQIADFISEHVNQVRLILIAGPSSSGKTTFAKRLGVQLRVNGVRPIPVSLDDYFVERDQTPLDETGKANFEQLAAIDLDLFNQHLAELLAGNRVEVPNYNFITGKREYKGRVLYLEPDQPLIVEGIHGLNECLTRSVSHDKKIKIYISALTQLSIDRHHPISTTDTRLLRRMVRDSKFRGHDARLSLKMWPSVRRGEEQNIFPFQEEADVMFNSALIYELAVLKKYAEPLLQKIDASDSEYAEATRLLNFLSYFVSIRDEDIPPNSILREFIGKSCFYGPKQM